MSAPATSLAEAKDIHEARRIYSSAGGGFRDVIIYVPESAQVGAAIPKRPLVVALHGKTQTAESFAKQTRLSDPAFNKEYITVYPTGLGYQWTGDPGAPPRAQINDIQFIDDLIQWMLTNYRVDPDRVYLVGFSNGAGLAALVACHPRISRSICAVGLASASIYLDESFKEPSFSKFEASRLPVPLLEFHGDADSVVDYNGVDTFDGPSWPMGDWLRSYIWMNEKGLHGHVLADDAEEQSLYDGKVERFSWRCGTEHEIVVHYIVRGFGHGWPSTTPIEDEKVRYGPTVLDATPIVLDFFKQCAAYERKDSKV